jgi:DNA-directed RNA polymerase specialized sigma24 family protein
VNVSSLLTLNPLIVNLQLGLYGLLFVGVFIYVHVKFRRAGRALQALTKDWASAEKLHTGLFETAQQRIASLTVESSVSTPVQAVAAPITADARSQVAAMGRRGIPISEIARTCGLPEGEVDVLLGMARMQRLEA